MIRRAMLLVTAAAIALAASAVEPGPQAAAAPEVTAPDIVLIITDDQRVGTLDPMPAVREQLRDQGAVYTGVIPTSLCCPSRTAILSGNHSHTTGVWSNRSGSGGWPVFFSSGYEALTIATALDDAGYRTGYFGKYLNNWNEAPDGYVPPGWDVFRAMWEPPPGQGAGAYYNYELRGTGKDVRYGHRTDDYSTDVLADLAVTFLKDAVAEPAPVLTMIATTGPHKPYLPARRHVDTWKPKHPYDNAAVNERDMSDKPPRMRDLPKVDEDHIHAIERRTGETLRSVDQLVERVLRQVDLSNTLVIYMSDNGVMWGEHRLVDKDLPYRWASEVPLIMRWDGVLEPGRYGMATNADVGATILDAAGVPRAFPTDGDTVLDGTTLATTMEAKHAPRHPAYCGVRTEDFLYVQYQNGNEELYDYRRDPLELTNRSRSPRYNATKLDLRQQAKQLCDPPPGSFTWGR